MIDRKKTIYMINLNTYISSMDIDILYRNDNIFTKHIVKGVTKHTIINKPYFMSNTHQSITYTDSKSSVESARVEQGNARCLISNDRKNLAKAGLKEISRMHQRELKELSNDYDKKCNELIDIMCEVDDDN